ncbi:hypothetical protein C1T15_28550, partial [Escherichia coli]
GPGGGATGRATLADRDGVAIGGRLMATLVLTTVGGLAGGPIGAALGGMLGQAVDRNVLFRPKGRHGPRLNDLAVQTSRYGQ